MLDLERLKEKLYEYLLSQVGCEWAEDMLFDIMQILENEEEEYNSSH